MKWYRPSGLAVYSSVTVDLDEAVIIDEGQWGKSQPEFVIQDLDVLRLDPGGMMFTKIPWHEFTVNGYNFEVQRHNIPILKILIERAKENKLGTKTIYVYPCMFVTMSSELLVALSEKLAELEKEDATLHESIDVSLVKGELDKHPNIHMNIKKEMPNAN